MGCRGGALVVRGLRPGIVFHGGRGTARVNT